MLLTYLKKPNQSQKQRKFLKLIPLQNDQNDEHTYPSAHREYMACPWAKRSLFYLLDVY